MNQQSYFKMLCDDLEQIASELDCQEPTCNFPDDETAFDNENYSDIFEGRD